MTSRHADDQVPQIVKTYRLKRAGELSPWAFAVWLFADCLILTGIAVQGLLITNLVLCVCRPVLG